MNTEEKKAAETESMERYQGAAGKRIVVCRDDLKLTPSRPRNAMDQTTVMVLNTETASLLRWTDVHHLDPRWRVQREDGREDLFAAASYSAVSGTWDPQNWAVVPDAPMVVTPPSPLDGEYFMWVRFRREYADDITLPKVQERMRDGATVEMALREQFESELRADLDREDTNVGGWEVVDGPTKEDDPMINFGMSPKLSGKPWHLRQYVEAARSVAERLHTIMVKLGVNVDDKLLADVEQLQYTTMLDLVGTTVEEIEAERERAVEERDNMADALAGVRSQLQSAAYDLDLALPNSHKDEPRRGRR
jgi:hypothetical protein